MKSLLLLWSFGFAAVSGQVNITDCGQGNGAEASFTNFSVTPATPVKGVPITFLGNGLLSSTSTALTGGSGQIVVSLDTLPLFTGQFATCGTTVISLPLGFGTLYVTSANCPLAPGGTFLLNVSVALPSASPSGSYDVMILDNDQAGNLAYCCEADFSL